MDVDADDEFLALQEGAPGGEQEVGEAGVEQRIVGVAQLVQQPAELRGSRRRETTRELTDRIALGQGWRRGAGHQARAEHRPPQLVVGGLVDEHVILAGKEPRQRAGRELVAPLAQKVGRASAYHEVELELGMPVAARCSVGDEVMADMPVNGGAEPEILAHRKKR
jgi:hypothetical protein